MLITVNGSPMRGKTREALMLSLRFKDDTLVICTEESPQKLCRILIEFGVKDNNLSQYSFYQCRPYVVMDTQELYKILNDNPKINNVIFDVNDKHNGKWYDLAKEISNVCDNVVLTQSDIQY